MAVQASIGTAAMPSMWSIRAAVESFYAREGCVCIAWTWSHNGCEEGALAWSDLHCNAPRPHLGRNGVSARCAGIRRRPRHFQRPRLRPGYPNTAMRQRTRSANQLTERQATGARVAFVTSVRAPRVPWRVRSVYVTEFDVNFDREGRKSIQVCRLDSLSAGRGRVCELRRWMKLGAKFGGAACACWCVAWTPAQY